MRRANGHPSALSRWPGSVRTPSCSSSSTVHASRGRRHGSAFSAALVGLPSAVAMKRPGNMNSTLAHTPKPSPTSPSRRPRPTWTASWIPAAGTTTTSGVNGSATGVRSTSASASSSGSSRSAWWRWIMGTPLPWNPCRRAGASLGCPRADPASSLRRG